MGTWKRFSIAITLAVATSAVLSAVLAAQQPTFRAGTQVVSLFVTVADAQKRLRAHPPHRDSPIFHNDKAQPFSYFDNSIHPINVVVMLDTSGSMTLTIDLLKQAAEQFVIRLLPEAKAKGGAVNDKIHI